MDNQLKQDLVEDNLFHLISEVISERFGVDINLVKSELQNHKDIQEALSDVIYYYLDPDSFSFE